MVFAAARLTWRPAVATTPHPINRAVLNHQQAQENVIRLQGNLDTRRRPRRERREKEAELARWRVRYAAAAKDLDDLAAPERRRLDNAEANLTGRLSNLHEQRERRDSWFAGHPEAARHLDSIERDLEMLTIDVDRLSPGGTPGRAASRDLPWLQDTPAIERGLDLGLGR